MRPTKSPAWVIALALSLTVASRIVHSEPAATIYGVYNLNAKASDDVDKILDVIADYQSDVQAFFRKRHPTYAKISIARESNVVIVTLDDGNPMRMPVSGDIAQWQREDGKTLAIKCQCQSTRMVQTIDTNDTLRVNEFSIDTDGRTLTLAVNFTGYPKPPSYKLVYQRQAAQ